jgi:iron complex transport system substrate-binding protein
MFLRISSRSRAALRLTSLNMPPCNMQSSYPTRRDAGQTMSRGGGAFAAVRIIPIRRWGRCIACLLLALVGPVQSAQVVDAMGQQVAVTDTSRIVTVGGELTEIVYALGAGERLAGADTTSTWPEAARQLPQVGYMRNLSAEGILSLSPTLVLATTNAGSPEVLAQLRLAGVTLVVLPARPTAEGALLKVHAVGEALDREAEAAVLARQIEEDLTQAQVRVRKLSARPRVLFLMGMAQGAPIAAGADTAAQAIIELAGGVNALSGFRGYRPVSPEALAAAEIDVVLVPRHALEALSGREGVLQQPGLALTRAAREQRLVVMDGLYLLGFGPRLGQAVQDLARLLHPQAFTAGQSHDRTR